MKYVNIGSAKAAVLEYRGQNYCLLYNGFAMFEMIDTLGKDFIANMSKNDAESINNLIEGIKILSDQGEAARRAVGLDPAPVFKDAEVIDPVFMGGGALLDLKNGCINAINLGNMREVTNEDEEIDLGLLELQKKRKQPKLSTSIQE